MKRVEVFVTDECLNELQRNMDLNGRAIASQKGNAFSNRVVISVPEAEKIYEITISDFDKAWDQIEPAYKSHAMYQVIKKGLFGE